MHNGWYQVAFERELTAPVTEVILGDRTLMLVRAGPRLAAYDAHCPHRGANLARGGRCDGEAIVCPFHGRRIGLGRPGEDGFFVRERRALAIGGLVFVLFDERHELGFAARMADLDRGHCFVPGFTVTVRCAPEAVIENAFDRRHFSQVHKLDETPDLRLAASTAGEMAVHGSFAPSRANPWQADAAPGIDFSARVYSPTVCVTELGAPGGAYVVLTAATPTTGRECLVRVSLALPTAGGAPPSPEVARALLRDSRTSVEQDKLIWDNLADQPIQFAPDDDLVREFYRFCRRLGEGPP